MRTRENVIDFVLGLVVSILVVGIYVSHGWLSDFCSLAIMLVLFKLCEPPLMRWYPKSEWARRFVRRPPERYRSSGQR